MTHDLRKLLIIEHDPGIETQLRSCFEDYEVLAAEDRQSAINQLRRHEPPVVMLDLGLQPEQDGVDEGFATLRQILILVPYTKVIVVTVDQDQGNAAKAVGLGAYDFCQRPADVDTLRLIVERAYQMHDLEAENRRLLECTSGSPLDGVIATSEAMLRVCAMVEKVAPTNATTLLHGESGTGKELLAQALHALSPRSKQPFIAINCAAIPENLLESELFGFEKGAFTGAVKQTPGKIEAADGGTLFLDEIGDMPMSLQAKLLRFLQERTLERLGGRAEIAVDTRVVCATNQNLDEAIHVGRFREDLFYRISEITIEIPPVRDREGDRNVIARYLLNKYAKQHMRMLSGFTAKAQDAIDLYHWPGNVREMENRIKGAVIMADGKFVTVEDLGLSAPEEPLDTNLRSVRQKSDSRAIRDALARTGGNISRAAELLGVTRPTLYDLLEKYDIEPESVSGKIA